MKPFDELMKDLAQFHQAKELEAQDVPHLNKLTDQLQEAQTALDSFMLYLRIKYTLREGDTIHPDGRIARVIRGPQKGQTDETDPGKRDTGISGPGGH